ncbi:hypothetical protein [Marivita sp. S2033]|uniref:hypothetical protein n=1 Tax=Marivita sp. S2033 TaxID=3373187 RepID=UPI003981CC50
MQPTNDAKSPSGDLTDLDRMFPEIPSDSFEVMLAASQAEDSCPAWIAERFFEEERGRA